MKHVFFFHQVVDFGLSKAFGDMGAANRVKCTPCGTRGYCAPEILQKGVFALLWPCNNSILPFTARGVIAAAAARMVAQKCH